MINYVKVIISTFVAQERKESYLRTGRGLSSFNGRGCPQSVSSFSKKKNEFEISYLLEVVVVAGTVTLIVEVTVVKVVRSVINRVVVARPGNPRTLINCRLTVLGRSALRRPEIYFEGQHDESNI